MAIINPTTGQDIKDKCFNHFVDKVVQFLYDHHYAAFCGLINLTRGCLEIDYGTAKISSAFYNTVTHRVWPRCYSFAHITGDFYLNKNWNTGRPRANNADFAHFKDMISTKFPMYKVCMVGGEFHLDNAVASPTSAAPVAHSHSAVVPTTADNLIRVDYTYMNPIYLRSVISPKVVSATCFDMTSNILAATGNVSFLALMDRIPVYVVDSKFMQADFDEEGNKVSLLLLKLRRLLEKILDIFHREEDVEKLSDTIKSTRELIDQLRGFEEYIKLIQQIKRFLDSVEGWIEEHGVHGALENPNFEPWLKGILDEFPSPQMSTEFLGVYCHEWKRVNGYSEKAIFICWERICDCAKKGHATDLLTKVTIHEFCHAYMDVIAGSGRSSKDIYHWMEESMANVLTLKIIETYVAKHPSAIGLFKYAKGFMLRQPDAYASAVRMWENGICDYDLWAWNKDKCVALTSVNNWYNNMSASWKSMSNDQIRDLWGKVRKDTLGI